jgi:hypothetical protein
MKHRLKEHYPRLKASKIGQAGVLRQKGDLLSMRGENRNRKKLGEDRHGV